MTGNENLSISRALLQNDDPQTKDGLGVLYLSTGRATKAEALFMEALQIRPNDPIVQVHLVSKKR
jgi:Flp pilus assembly protein TadD